jgi:uncharacterized repeat protein (TIGR04138 family)
MRAMPPTDEPTQGKTLDDVVAEIGLYPAEAYEFVQQGLSFTVNQIHGELTDPEINRHITGPQLCEGLREFALLQWGMLARTVLRRWNITSTMDFGRIVFALVDNNDFGRIVFALVDNNFLQKQEGDSVEDFRNVFDFRSAFEAEYRIESKP